MPVLQLHGHATGLPLGPHLQALLGGKPAAERHLDLAREHVGDQSVGVGDESNFDLVDLGPTKHESVIGREHQIRIALPVAQREWSRADKLRRPVRQLDESRFVLLVGLLQDVTRDGHGELGVEHLVGVDVRLLPVGDERPRVRRVVAVEELEARVREHGEILVLRDLRGEGEVRGRKWLAVLPLRAVANLQRRVHTAIRKQLPQAVTEGGYSFGELRRQTAVSLQLHHPRGHQQLQLADAASGPRAGGVDRAAERPRHVEDRDRELAGRGASLPRRLAWSARAWRLPGAAGQQRGEDDEENTDPGNTEQGSTLLAVASCSRPTSTTVALCLPAKHLGRPFGTRLRYDGPRMNVARFTKRAR